MKLVRKGKISYLQPTNLPAGLVAGFSTRNGGVSRPPFNSLNMGFGTADHPTNVESNRASFIRAFGLAPHQLLTVKQVHGDDILLIDENNPDLSHFLGVEVDAIITNQSEIMIGILTADCFPLLIWHEKMKIIAAIHVGWRGAANGLIAKVIQTIQTHFNCPAEELQAAIGPGIGAHSYEVDRPVRDAFRQGSGFWKEISKETSLGHWQLDIPLSCQLQLEQSQLQVQNIETSKECTCCHPELFFSHRRDNGVTGRQISFLKLGE
ncbi:peptidoglycan editing factor PgeF [uncultured Desulfuromusa sp.]|uniref:peptidoglycan editing factor PgeF n=1 Tax=uncultured Desulfuromusa sp. TaxID=219183 RepID=UPI002AA651EB|nr:peptidoglycan editing factor PgeF [uncultured Desulfuromusa sp.]